MCNASPKLPLEWPGGVIFVKFGEKLTILQDTGREWPIFKVALREKLSNALLMARTANRERPRKCPQIGRNLIFSLAGSLDEENIYQFPAAFLTISSSLSRGSLPGAAGRVLCLSKQPPPHLPLVISSRLADATLEVGRECSDELFTN